MHHAMVSLRPRYIEMLLNGTKTVELRRRRLHLPDRTVLWLYSTLPVGDVVAAACVARIHHGTPASVWRDFAPRTGLTLHEYRTYTRHASWVTAIELERVIPLVRSIPLREIREVRSAFNPPQSILSIGHEDPVFRCLNKTLPDLLLRNDANRACGHSSTRPYKRLELTLASKW